MLVKTANKNVPPLIARQGYCFLVALCLTILLCALPQTGWMARRQIAWHGSAPDLLNAEAESREDTQQTKLRKQEAAAAKRHDQLDVQLAWIVERQKLEDRLLFHKLDRQNLPDDIHVAALKHEQSANRRRLLSQIWELRHVFPNEPAVYASYLRHACAKNIGIGRDLERELVYCNTPQQARIRLKAKQAASGVQEPPSLWETDPSFVQNVLEAARQGEHFDPDNSFFPVMQAAALFAQKQDESAVQSLERAASRHRWNDYVRPEITGKIKLAEATDGPMSAAQREIYALDFNAPHLGTIRATAVVAVTLAALQERRQDFAGGLRLRKAIARVGMRLRVAAPYYGANKNGHDLICYASWRPGGVAPQTNVSSGVAGAPVGFSSGPAHMSDSATVSTIPCDNGPPPTGSEEYEGFSRSRTSPVAGQRYVDYLKRHGEMDEARWYAQESATANLAHDFTDKYNHEAVYSQMMQLDVWWFTGAVLIAQTFSAFVLGGVGAWVSRSARGRMGKPLGREGRWAFAIIPLALLGGLGCSALVDYLFARCVCFDSVSLYLGYSGKYLFGIGFSLLVAFLPLLTFRKPPRGEDWTQSQRKKQFRAAIWHYAQTISGTAAVVIVLLLLNAICMQISAASSFMGMLYCHSQGDVPWMLSPVMGSVCLLSLTVIPLCAGVTIIVSLVRRIPVSVGLARGACLLAPQIALGFIIVWTGVILLTVSLEKKTCRQLEISAEHECRYQAAAVGTTWPGETTEVKTSRVAGKGERL